jgi:hypothetical protein
MATPIIPRLVRGRVFFRIADPLSSIFVQAAGLCAAAMAHGLDTIGEVRHG